MVMAAFCFIVAVVAAWVGVGATTAANMGHLKIGGVFPLLTNNVFNQDGAERQAAFLMAIRDINNKSDGIADNILQDLHVVYAVRDSQLTFTNAVLAALDMTENCFPPDGIDGLIGAGDNSVTEALAAVLGGNDIPQISYGASAPELSQSNLYPDFTRVYPSDAFQGTAAIHMIHNHGWSRVISFSSTDTLGSDSTFEFTNTAAILNINILYSAAFPSGTSEFSSFISQAMPFDCRVFVFFITNPADASALLLEGFAANLFTSSTALFFSLALNTPITYSATVAKYGGAALQGAMAFSPMINVWKTLPAGIALLNRYLAQPATVSYNALGQTICHNDTDSTGAFLYKELRIGAKATGPAATVDFTPNILIANNDMATYQYVSTTTVTDAYICTGVDFSTLAADGSDTSPFVGFVYDATMAFFHVIDFMLKQNVLTAQTINATTISGILVKQYLVSNVTFAGATGDNDFSSGRAGSKVYGYGDRAAGLGFVVNNFQGTNLTNWRFKRVGRWLQSQGFVSCTTASDPGWLGGCHLPILYANPENMYSAAPDRAPDIIQLNPVGIQAIEIILALVVGIAAIALALTIFVFKAKTRLVKASQPVMMGFIIFGMVLGAVRIGLSAAPVSDAVCNCNLWFGHLAFSFTFFAMAVKTWRVFMIIRGGLKKVRITSKHVLILTLALCSIIVGVLILYSAVGKPYLSYQVVPLLSGNNLVKPICATNYPQFDTILTVIEAISLAVASYFCFKIKDVPDAINESKFIAMAVFLIVFISVAGLPITLTLPLDPYLSQLVISICFFMALVGGNSFYFGNKVYLLWIGADLNHQFKIVYRDGDDHNSQHSDHSDTLKSMSEGDMVANTNIPAAKRLEFMKTVPDDVNSSVCAERIALWTELKIDLDMKERAAKRIMRSGAGSSDSQSKTVTTKVKSPSAFERISNRTKPRESVASGRVASTNEDDVPVLAGPGLSTRSPKPREESIKEDDDGPVWIGSHYPPV